MNNTEWIVFVTRHYHCLVKPFVTLWDRYFGVPLTFFSDRPITDIDSKHRVMEVFPFDCALYREPCGALIKRGLSEIQTPLISIQLIDQLLQGDVNKSHISVLEQFMLKNPVARGNLYADFENAIGDIMTDDPTTVLHQDGGLSIIFVDSNNPHIGGVGTTNLLPAIWNRQFLLEFIEDHWSFDVIEMPGANKFIAQNKWYSVGTYPANFKTAHLIYTRDVNLVELTQLKDNDRLMVKSHIPNTLRTVVNTDV